MGCGREEENDLCFPFLFSMPCVYVCVCVAVLCLRCCVGFSLTVAG